jgi:RNase P subunit RPR2
MTPPNSPDNSTSHPLTDNDNAHPPYTHLEPSCPVCGNSQFSSTDEGIPHGYDAHYVHVTCANCHTVLTIEYRAIDLSWTDGHDERHSAVSHGLLTPTQTNYGDPLMDAPLPNTTVLRGLDWPYHCEECTEPLTGNDLVAEPRDLAPDESEAAASPHVLFHCLNCDHRTTRGVTEQS